MTFVRAEERRTQGAVTTQARQRLISAGGAARTQEAGQDEEDGRCHSQAGEGHC